MRTEVTIPKRIRHADECLEEIHKAHRVLHPAINKYLMGDLIAIKKERATQNAERRPLFMILGLSISLLITVIAINWKTYDLTSVVDLGDVNADFDEIMEVPISNQPPPPPPKQLEQLVIEVVNDDLLIEEVEVNLDVELTEDMAVKDLIYSDLPILDAEDEVADEIFSIVEDRAEFPGGIGQFYKYVGENVEYPPLARRLGVSGKVFLKFVVEKDGRITDVQVLKGIGSGCDEEAVRVIQNSPKWQPAKQRGNKVRMYMTVPINFTLRE